MEDEEEIAMCIWNVSEGERRCEFCSFYGGCEGHETVILIEDIGNRYIDMVSGLVGVDIRDRTRKHEVVWGRDMVFFQLWKSGYKQEDIGKFMGYNHATVFHGIRNIGNMLKYPFAYMVEYNIWIQFQQLIEKCGKKSENGGCSE